MKKVIKLTEEQAEQLKGHQFKMDSYFAPTKDADGNWYISTEEAQYNTNTEFDWVSNCPFIDFNPVIEDMEDI